MGHRTTEHSKTRGQRKGRPAPQLGRPLALLRLTLRPRKGVTVVNEFATAPDFASTSGDKIPVRRTRHPRAVVVATASRMHREGADFASVARELGMSDHPKNGLGRALRRA